MKIDQILVLKTILEEGSFRAASAKLNRAQSAVSYAIRNLEEDLGFSIFDRSGYRPELTAKGKAYYQKSAAVFVALKSLESYAKTLRQGCEPLVRLSISAILPIQPVIASFSQLKWRFPQTELQLNIDVLSGDRLLVEDQIDLALSDVKGKAEEVESVLVGEVKMTAVAGKHSQKRNISEIPQVVVKSSIYTSERSAGIINKQNTWSVSDFASKKELIKADLGWGYMPNHLIDSELKEGSLKALSIESNAVAIYLCRLRDKVQGPSAQLLWQELQQLKF